MSRWLITFDAIDPRDPNSRWTTGVSPAHYDRIRRSGHECQAARLLLVQEVLDPPKTLHVFRGWSRPDRDDCFVYSGLPARDFRSLTIETPAPPRMTFLVFVLPDGTIDHWTWRPSASGNGIPDGVDGELIWSATPN
jgi:hypothetical protein